MVDLAAHDGCYQGRGDIINEEEELIGGDDFVDEVIGFGVEVLDVARQEVIRAAGSCSSVNVGVVRVWPGVGAVDGVIPDAAHFEG